MIGMINVVPTSVFNVKAFGAAGDGVTDDSTAIAAAITQLTAGSTLYFPAPSGAGYHCGVTQAFSLRAGARIAGVARQGVLAPDPLTQQSNTPLVLVPDSAGLLGPNKGYVFDGEGGRIVYPGNGFQIFAATAVAGRNHGEYVIAVMRKNGAKWNVEMAYSNDCLATFIFEDWISKSDMVDQFDPEIVLLPDGRILVAWHEIGLHFALSADGGRTWTPKGTLAPPNKHLYRSIKMVMSKGIGSGTFQRIIFLFSDLDTDKAMTQYRTCYTDDLATTFSATTVVGPNIIGSVTNQINDADHGAIFERLDGTIGVIFPFKHDGDSGKIYAEDCNSLGQSPSGSPTLVTTVPLFSGSARLGGFPHVIPLRTGGVNREYGLFFSATDQGTGGNTGELHFMTNSGGLKNGWQFDRKVYAVTGFPNGYGFFRPVRKSDGLIDLLHVGVTSSTNSDIRSVIAYGI